MREGGAKEQNCRQRQRLLPLRFLLLFLLLKGKNRQRKRRSFRLPLGRRRRRQLHLGKATHRSSHTEKPNLSSLFLASLATAHVDRRTVQRAVPSCFPLSLPSYSVGQWSSARDVLLGDGRRGRRAARRHLRQAAGKREPCAYGTLGCVNSRQLYGSLAISKEAVGMERRVQVIR